MKLDSVLLQEIESDLGINITFEKGRRIPVRNCWHFSTDGNTVDAVFEDDEDFRNGMNRVFLVVRNYRIVILAFCLMDTHIHFIIWGSYDDCNQFMHEYIRRTSMDITRKHGHSKKLENVPVHCQKIDNVFYLKVCICYVIKNPPVGGIAYNALDYPWSSAPLYFRRSGNWAAPNWTDGRHSIELGGNLKRTVLRTRDTSREMVEITDNEMVFPGAYVAYEIVESLFRTCKGFNYFMCITKEEDVETKDGRISRLSIPMQEMRQNKATVCLKLFGTKSTNKLSMPQRIKLAKVLKAQYHSSTKQILRLCGIRYEEGKDLI